MRILKKLQVVKVCSLLAVLHYQIVLAQASDIQIEMFSQEKLFRYVVENDNERHYYGCPSCSEQFAYETGTSFFYCNEKQIDTKIILSDILMQYYIGNSSSRKYILFVSRLDECHKEECSEWYYYVVPVHKKPQDACRVISLCQERIPKSDQNPSHESIFRDMIRRWEQDGRCFND